MTDFRAEEFYRFMVARERIRLDKRAGMPKPWTKDPILRQFKFTNVKRYHDRTSQLLIEEFYKPYHYKPRKQILLNAAIFRYFGTIEYAREVDWQEDFDSRFLIKTATRMFAQRRKVFTGAYIITNNGMAGPKHEVVVKHFIKPLWKVADSIVEAAKARWYWEDAIGALRTVPGFGGTGFMAKEVILDTRYTAFWPAHTPYDVNAWTPIGPGSKRGAARILGRDPNPPLGEQATLEVCRRLFDARVEHWPEGYVDLELHDIQFQLCEFDKYERCRLGEGRPRSRYDGG